MGFVLSSIFPAFFAKRQLRILMVGLDGAGKTTILYRLKLGEVVSTVPTIVEFRGSMFTVWDVGGQDRIRALWKHYYANSNGIIFVVDSTDSDRLELARDELKMMLAEPELLRVTVLVYANKQDLPNAMSTQEVAEGLGLHLDRKRKWYIQGACALNGDGLIEGLTWLSNSV